MDAASLLSAKSKINKLTFSHLDVQHSGQDVSTFGTTISYVPKKQYLCNEIQEGVTLTIPSARRGV